MFRRLRIRTETDALTRARILYYMQIGYNAAELNEPMNDRLALLPYYLIGFTGKQAEQEEIDEFLAFANAVQERDET